VKLSTTLRAVPNLGISGATTPFPHVSLCLALGQLYLYFSGVCENVHYPSCSAKIANKWSYNSIPPRIFMSCTGTTSNLVGCVKMSTILHAVPKFRISGATTPLPHVSLCLALGQLYLYFSGVCENVHYPSCSAKIANKWSYKSILPCTFMPCTGTTLPLL